MSTKRFNSRAALSIVCALLMVATGMPLAAQEPAPPPEQPAAQMLPPQQLDNLVAPIALYPDSLLSQVLVAATYPLEVAEAAQWLQQNRNLQGPQLVDAARQQNWDASIQALVVFPDVLSRMNSDIRWTTDLGNAFLAQQSDVMNAVQRMRAQARAAGRLNSNAQQTVTTETQGGNSAIEIQPANPQVVYVPVYNPAYIWGPPVWGYYPPLYYPAFGFGFGFGPGIYIGGFFGGLGWGGWGWWPNWFGFSICERPFFFSHYGYHGFVGVGRFGGYGVWAHNPEHRLGVAYSNRAVANRFGGFSGRGAALAGGRYAGGNNSGYRGTAGITSRAGSQAYRGGAQAGNWSHFSQARPNTSQGFQHTTPSYQQRATPSYSGNRGSSGAARNYARSTPSYRSTPSSSTPSYRSTPSNGRGYQASHPSSGRSYTGGNRGGGGAFHGGGSSHTSGGGSHASGGGSHGGGGGGHHR